MIKIDKVYWYGRKSFNFMKQLSGCLAVWVLFISQSKLDFLAEKYKNLCIGWL